MIIYSLKFVGKFEAVHLVWEGERDVRFVLAGYPRVLEGFKGGVALGDVETSNLQIEVPGEAREVAGEVKLVNLGQLQFVAFWAIGTSKKRVITSC